MSGNLATKTYAFENFTDHEALKDPSILFEGLNSLGTPVIMSQRTYSVKKLIFSIKTLPIKEGY